MAFPLRQSLLNTKQIALPNGTLRISMSLYQWYRSGLIHAPCAASHSRRHPKQARFQGFLVNPMLALAVFLLTTFAGRCLLKAPQWLLVPSIADKKASQSLPAPRVRHLPPAKPCARPSPCLRGHHGSSYFSQAFVPCCSFSHRLCADACSRKTRRLRGLTSICCRTHPVAGLRIGLELMLSKA